MRNRITVSSLYLSTLILVFNHIQNNKVLPVFVHSVKLFYSQCSLIVHMGSIARWWNIRDYILYSKPRTCIMNANIYG